jgi:hypothetical protein
MREGLTRGSGGPRSRRRVCGAGEEKAADEREAREEAGEQANHHIGGRITATGTGRNLRPEEVPREIVTSPGGVG